MAKCLMGFKYAAVRDAFYYLGDESKMDWSGWIYFELGSVLRAY